MFKGILSRALFVGLMAVSAISNAEILVNHHNQPYQEYTRQISHHRAMSKITHPHRHQRGHHQPRHHRGYSQHSKVVDSCLRMKSGRHYRVC